MTQSTAEEGSIIQERLEQSFYDWLLDQNSITAETGVYANKPAIFLRKVPEDTDAGWEKRYPCICIDIWEEIKRKKRSKGFLRCRIYRDPGTDEGNGLKDRLRTSAGGRIIQRPDLPPVYLSFGMSSPMENMQGTYGEEIRFELFELPAQTTYGQDALNAAAECIRLKYPSAKLAGIDAVDACWKADAEHQAFYTELLGQQSDSETSAVSWAKVRLKFYALTEDRQLQLMWLKGLYEHFTFQEQIDMEDQSPLIIRQLQIAGDEKIPYEPYLLLTARYGLNREREEGEKMNNIHTDSAI